MQKPLLLFFLLGTLAMMVVMSKTGASLKTPTTPIGILNLELPFTKEKANTVLASWQTSNNDKGISNKRVAILNTRWDFLFIFFYSGLLLMLTGLIAHRHSGMLQKAGVLFQKAVWVVALLDVLENFGMFRILAGSVSSTVVLFTSVCSALKWLLVLQIIAFILIAGFIMLFRKRK